MPSNAVSNDPALSMSAMKERSPTPRNTKRLGMRFGVDIASAATAGALTCPVITVIDRYVRAGWNVKRI